MHVHLSSFSNFPCVSSGSVDELRSLRDQSNIFVQSSKYLDRPVQHWDDWLVYSVTQRLDLDSRRAWELKLGDATDYPTFEQLNKFLESRIRALETIVPRQFNIEQRGKKEMRKSTHPIQAHNGTQSSSDKCTLCRGNNFLAHCYVFKNKYAQQRLGLIKKFKRCTNCFSARHKRKDCKNSFSCRVCQKRHHTLLHFDEVKVPNDANSAENQASASVDPNANNTKNGPHRVTSVSNWTHQRT